MDDGGENWELVAKIAEMVIDTAESVEGLQRIMAEDNAHAMAMLGRHRPDLLPALRNRFALRKAHLYTIGKVKAEPLPDDEPAPAPANAIRRRA